MARGSKKKKRQVKSPIPGTPPLSVRKYTRVIRRPVDRFGNMYTIQVRYKEGDMEEVTDHEVFNPFYSLLLERHGVSEIKRKFNSRDIDKMSEEEIDKHYEEFEKRMEKADKHFLKILNDIEKMLVEKYGNAFDDCYHPEDVTAVTTEMMEAVPWDASYILSEVFNKHKEKMKEADLVLYRSLQPYVESRIRWILSKLSIARRIQLRKMLGLEE